MIILFLALISSSVSPLGIELICIVSIFIVFLAKMRREKPFTKFVNV